MPLPDRDGQFRAYPVEWGCDATGPNDLLTWTCRWNIVQWWGAKEGEWFDMTEMGFEITSYSYITKRDGNLNESAITQLRDSLGWDGRDLPGLSKTDWSERGCCLTCNWDEYKGKTKLKVDWIDTWEPGGGPGRVKKADDATLKKFQAQLGGQLKAISPASGDDAAPPAGSPSPKPPPPPPPKPVSTAKHEPVDDSEIPFSWAIAFVPMLGMLQMLT